MQENKNENRLQIEILCDLCNGADAYARALSYGIEEEGLPYLIRFGDDFAPKDAYEIAQGAGLGVAALVRNGWVSVFARQLKEEKPLFYEPLMNLETVKTIGKNAARVIKNKPFLEME